MFKMIQISLQLYIIKLHFYLSDHYLVYILHLVYM